MSHMVIYRGVDGKPGYHQTDDIHDAVSFVEQMRNEEGVEHARIFRLEEVVFEYRPYYRVELTDSASSNGDAQLAEGNGTAKQVGAGSDEAALEDAIDIDESPTEDAGDIGDGEKAEVGGAKKGLFGR